MDSSEMTSAAKSSQYHVHMATGHQRSVVQVLLLLAMPVGLIYALVNIHREQYALAMVEGLFSLLALYFWRSVKIKKHSKKILIGFTFPLFIMISYSLSQPFASPTMFVFVFVVPVLIYPTFGFKQGQYVTALFYIAMYIQLFYRFGGEGFYQQTAALINIVVCSMAVWGIVHAYEKGRSLSQAKLSDLATTDPLTGLNNRLGLEVAFDQYREDSNAVGSGLGMIMVDLDFFKSINDTYGHSAGDAVLCSVAGILRKRIRPHDSVYRLGGEEFCLFLRVMSARELNSAAESIRARIQSLAVIFEGQEIHVTGSLGVVMLGDGRASLYSMLTEADKRLYAAKNAGRNCVITEDVVDVAVA